MDSAHASDVEYPPSTEKMKLSVSFFFSYWNTEKGLTWVAGHHTYFQAK